VTDSPLDSLDTYARLDPAGLYSRIASLPGQIAQAHAAAMELELPRNYLDVERVAILGMGGSGIGGSLLRALAIDIGAVTPIDVVRGYTLPAYINASTLAIASSNSGNTEEVIALADQASSRGAKCLAMTTGGALLELSHERAFPALTYQWQGEPRAALGWSFATLLALCTRAGVLDAQTLSFEESLASMRDLIASIGRDVATQANPAKQVALRLIDKLPVIVGAEAMAPVAYRWRTQLNENAKTWAVAEELPEMNHNAPVGYAAPASVAPSVHAVLLRHASAHPRVLKRIALTHEQMSAAGVSVEVLDVPGRTILAQMLRAIAFGDFVSYYLGLLNGADPSEVRALDWFKARMAAQGSGN
jgi:glucose/mannose-6-phosphate isomerase